MSSPPMALEVRPRGNPIKSLPQETFVTLTDNTNDLYLRIAAKSRVSIHQLRITKGSDGSHIPDSKNISIEETGLRESSTIYVKDLGPQIAWRTVFIIEYLGPLLFHPLIYGLRKTIYRNPSSILPFPAASTAQTLSLTLICLHFLKREFETLFVHRFSNATMPVNNIYKNSAHYWLLAGLNIALFTYSPSTSCPTSHPFPAWIHALSIVLFTVGELGNFSAHLTLRNLRSQGTGERGIPDTGVFRYVPVTCPNYLFETIAWAGIWLANGSLSTGLFVAVAVVQMVLWARKKEARYRREFGDRYKKKRFAMLPGLV